MNTFYLNRHIVVTGGFGLVGSALIKLLNSKGIAPYVIEKGEMGQKARNVEGLAYHLVKEPPYPGLPSTIIHMGASVDTTAPMTPELVANNIDYSLKLFNTRHDYCGPTPRFIYASSAAIYGKEERDFRERITNIHPVNAYSRTKLYLDAVFNGVPNVYGLRFFNVWDAKREAHKGNMKSIVGRALDIKDGVFEIFKTGRSDIPDGEQSRDFIHADDICSVIWHFITTEDDTGGLFNVGTGVATSFHEIADILGLQKRYIDMPPKLREQYQFRTCADITKLRAHGYSKPFMSVREGVEKMGKVG